MPNFSWVQMFDKVLLKYLILWVKHRVQLIGCTRNPNCLS